MTYKELFNQTIKKILLRIDKKYLLKHTKYFDESYYSSTYNIPLKEVYKHYLTIGDREGYNASLYFNSNTYRELNIDIKKDTNALLHYVVYGLYEKRRTNVYLNPTNNNEININQNNIVSNNIKHEINDISLQNLLCLLEYENASIFNKPKDFNKKYCLIYTHELDLTGAPIALFNMALAIRNLGIVPIVISPNYGKLINNYNKENITVIVYKELVRSSLVDSFWSLFDFIVLNTLFYSDVCSKLNGTKNEVIWWIHEAEFSYKCLEEKFKLLPQKLCQNIHIYTVGEYAKEKLLKFRPKYNSNNLLYCLPDSINTSNKLDFDFKKNNLYTFAVIGTLEPRKGYDILLESLESIDNEFKNKVQIVIVGKKCHEDIYNSITRNKVLKICYIESIDKDNMIDFYKHIDCLICPSLDDTMPIVVCEAWKYKIPVIISENTGSARLINEYGGGLVYEANDPVKLAEEINKVLFNEVDLNKLTSEGYNIYSKFFTKDIFGKNIKNIMLLSN